MSMAACGAVGDPGPASAAAPKFFPLAGSYETDQEVRLSSASAGAAIFYTRDGSDPDASSLRYSDDEPIAIEGDGTSVTIKAMAVLEGMRDSPIASAAYHIEYPDVPPGGQIIADHTIVDRWDDIPESYIALVKCMWFNLPGESHSQAYRSGLGLLEELDSRFATDATADADTDPAPAAATDQYLRASRNTWQDYKWCPQDGESYWYATTSDSVTSSWKNRNHLDHCASEGMPVGAYGFGWCWDMVSNSAIPEFGQVDPVYKVHWFGWSEGGPEGSHAWGLDADDKELTGGNSICMDTYLAATQSYAEYCASQGYPTKVFFTTGPVDKTGEQGYQCQIKHEYIRNFVKADSSRILFDYADILSYNDAGEPATASWTDGDGEVHVFPVLHPDNQTGTDIGHIGPAGALRLGKAIWWMLARMAGWEG